MNGEDGSNNAAEENLIAVYEALTSARYGITEFRAKLLAVLPFAAGTAAFVLIG